MQNDQSMKARQAPHKGKSYTCPYSLSWHYLSHHCSTRCSQRSLQSTNMMMKLFSLKPQSFFQGKEQNLCPVPKPWGLVSSSLWGHISRHTLLPDAFGLQTGHSLLPHSLCACFFFFFVLPGTLFTIHFCLITPIHHSALTTTSLFREPDLTDYSGLLIISSLGTMSLYDISEHSYNSTLFLWLFV